MSDRMTRFRPRYTIVDHENSQTHLIGGPYFVLFPASNFADYAAMKTVIGNVDPDMGISLQQHLELIDKFPDRTLSKFGIKSIPFIQDPVLRPQARAWAQRHGIFVPEEEPPRFEPQQYHVGSWDGVTRIETSTNGNGAVLCKNCKSLIDSVS